MYRFVGYLEEQAVLTYTQAIEDLEQRSAQKWTTLEAPDEAIKYWRLNKNSPFRDKLISIRADEVNHREYNHHFADIPRDKPSEGHELYIKDDLVEEVDASKF